MDRRRVLDRTLSEISCLTTEGDIQLYTFDILVHRERNVLRLPIEERRELPTEHYAKFNIQ